MKKWLALGLGAIAAFFIYRSIFLPQPFDGNLPNPPPLPDKKSSTFRIAFGSCSRQDEPQPLWPVIRQSSPNLWIWLGDNIYADTDDMEKMRAMYDRAKNQPEYQKLIRSTRVIGTWDDHDYGADNADARFPKKEESQQLLLDFLSEPADSPRRNQKGVYADYWYEREGFRIHILLLDTRSHRTEADMLGEEQWRWLESRLLETADVTFLGSSTQVVRDNYWKQKWGDIPAAKKRLLRTVAACRNVILISGDRHHGELSRWDDPALPAGLFELTSSGMTHYKNHLWYWSGQERNDHRLGYAYGYLNFGVVDVDVVSRRVDLYIVDADGRVRISQRMALSP